ncbi:MAG: hypothetical protein IKZ50_06320 [Bacteroidales bacterium]|nr:hypothetical protein [Bacteroidales bacterium]
MKKTIIILSAILAFVACNQEIIQPEDTSTVFNITITREGDTKAVKSAWEDGDVVYLFFSTVAAPNYVKLSYSGGSWTSTKVGTFGITVDGTMTAIYLPYGNSETVSADGTNFKFGNTYTSYYLKAEKAAYTVSGGVVSGTLNMVTPDGLVQFAMPLTNGTTQFFRETAGAYTLSEAHLTPFAFASVAADGTISNETGYSAGDPITGYLYGEGNARTINFSGILGTPGTATDYAFSFVNNMGTVATYDDVTYTLSGNRTIAAKSAIKFPLISSSAWKVPEPEYVTVGGIKWAKWNVGASTQEGYGDYYAWGAIYPQYRYKEDDYKEGSIGSNLTTDKDVAYQKMGTNWRMPTKAQLEELAKKTDPWTYAHPSTWTTINGVNGRLFSPDAGHESEGNLFLPAAGSYQGAGFWYLGTFGYYWSSAYKESDTANYLIFDDDNHIDFDYIYREYGLTVRPVHN